MNFCNLLYNKWVIKYLGGRIDWISEIEDIEAEVLWAGYLQSQ